MLSCIEQSAWSCCTAHEEGGESASHLASRAPEGDGEVVSTSRRSMRDLAAGMDAGEVERVGSIGAS